MAFLGSARSPATPDLQPFSKSKLELNSKKSISSDAQKFRLFISSFFAPKCQIKLGENHISTCN